jgi:Cu2+-exporting ATPase
MTTTSLVPPVHALRGTPPDSLDAADAGLQVVDDTVEQGRFTRWISGPQGQRWGESTLQLSGLHCAACAGIIEAALLRVPGVSAARVSPTTERATVCWDPARTLPSDFMRAVQRAGYGAVPDAAAPARALRRQEQRQALWRLFVASFCAMQVMMMATPSYVAGPGDLAPDMRQLLNWGAWLLSLPVMVFSSTPFFRGALSALRARRIGMDVPVTLGIVIAFVASSGATFNPQGVFGHEVYFDSLTMFVSFLLASRWLELHARHRAAEQLEESLARLPQTAWRVSADGQTHAVSVQRLQAGDLVRVPIGQAFPADGVLEQGQTQADESLLTGESLPVPKGQGDEAVAGSVNLGSPVLMRLTRVGQDTRFEAIVSMMRSAMGQRPASAALADRWAGPFLWVVLVLAAGAAAAWSVIDPSKAVWVAVSVLIVTCPCALSLAAPAAMVAAARGLAQRGVMLQRLDALEPLAKADHFFFDKTGTLTEDRLQLRQVLLATPGEHPGPAEGRFADAPTALRAAASLAAWSSHPLSQALVKALQDTQTGAAASAPGSQGEVPDLSSSSPVLQWQDVQEVPGQGLQASDAQGRVWRLGRKDWVATATAAPASTATAAEVTQEMRSQLAFGAVGCVLAEFEFEETLRAGTAQALQDLQAQGVQLTLLTGDAWPRAKALAARLGITHVVAAATPQDKLAAVTAAQAAGQRVVMVGDGVNDAPVLARADVSLAMGQGALVSRSQADAVITSDRLLDLLRARTTAQKTLRIVRQNFWWAGAYNALCIPLALVGWLPPWAAGLGMACSSLVVVGNALRAAR